MTISVKLIMYYKKMRRKSLIKIWQSSDWFIKEWKKPVGDWRIANNKKNVFEEFRYIWMIVFYYPACLCFDYIYPHQMAGLLSYMYNLTIPPQMVTIFKFGGHCPPNLKIIFSIYVLKNRHLLDSKYILKLSDKKILENFIRKEING